MSIRTVRKSPGLYVSASLSAAGVVLATGCVSQQGEFPTLARRNIETVYASGALPTPAPVPVTPADPQLLDKLNILISRAEDGQQAFAQALSAARRSAAAARGGEVGGENWAVATTAISALESSRRDSAITLADLDQLYADSVTDETNSIGADRAIYDTREKVMAIVAAQNAQIAELRSSIGD